MTQKVHSKSEGERWKPEIGCWQSTNRIFPVHLTSALDVGTSGTKKVEELNTYALQSSVEVRTLVIVQVRENTVLILQVTVGTSTGSVETASLADAILLMSRSGFWMI